MRLPDGYRRIRYDLPYKFLSAITYSAAVAFSWIYLKFFLHVSYKKSTKIKSGAFIYGNHTQPVGDVFIPAYAAFPRRIFTVVSPANYALPVIGKILPYLGAIPTPSGLKDLTDFGNALKTRVSEGHPIVIFPEAHVWEYCSFIRDFPKSSFAYPIKSNAPSYALTVTYSERRFGSKPKATIFLDGPFFAPSEGTERERSEQLRDTILQAMKKRAENSSSHIDYVKFGV